MYNTITMLALLTVLTGAVTAKAGEPETTLTVNAARQTPAATTPSTTNNETMPLGLEPTVRELYSTAHAAAQQAAEGIDPDASLQALQAGVESAAAYIGQELSRVESASRPAESAPDLQQPQPPVGQESGATDTPCESDAQNKGTTP